MSCLTHVIRIKLDRPLTNTVKRIEPTIIRHVDQAVRTPSGSCGVPSSVRSTPSRTRLRCRNRRPLEVSPLLPSLLSPSSFSPPKSPRIPFLPRSFVVAFALLSMMTSMATAPSYWCYRCSRFVRVWPRDAVVCPDCGGGFLEEVDSPPRPLPVSAASAEPRRRRFPSAAVDGAGVRRHHRSSAGERSPFNPVIVLRGPPEGRGDADRATGNSFELYYDDGSGSGLRPLPESMSDFLMGSGFERLLDQLAQIEVNGFGGGGGFEHPPASKAAIESMPTIEIADGHIMMESHCAVCKDPFELGAEAREMPCKHIYHQDCILPWLLLRNSCPVCRHEMPTDAPERGMAEPEADEQAHVAGNEEEMVGLTIWRLPGGGFAVGRFTGGRRAGERGLPVVYTEVDGGFTTGGAPRRISWSSRGSRSREGGGIGQAFRSFFSFFRRLRSSSTTSSRLSSESRSTSTSSLRSRRHSIFSRSSRSRTTNWALEDGNASAIARW
ncbi:hypothetical protein C4D60_Mb03t18810 [Musa balbisiana]|uniref:RING-type E3 ubiquitin transferase n=1 Tax=Musa balbisiana TaxID=52838 RepID=A0A4S8JBZ4_MUSBA|nr:hypothetical protein C4D60_Mb03t18810 [Musa balbisiana]